MYTYDESALLVTLESLPASAQSAFAQACALRTQRLGGAPLGEEANVLCARALHLARAFIDSAEIDRPSIEQVWAAMDISDELDDDRMAACGYVVRHLLSNTPQEAAWAARRAYEACDSLASSALEFDVYTAEIENRLLEHDAVQAELGQQFADIEMLRKDPAAGQQVVARAADVSA